MSIVLLRSHTTTTTTTTTDHTAHHILQGGNSVEEIRKVNTSHDQPYILYLPPWSSQTTDVIWGLFLMAEPAASLWWYWLYSLWYVCWSVVIGNITMAGLQLNGLLRFRLVELRRLHIGLAHEESVGVESSSLQQVSDDVSLTVWCRDY